MNRVSPGTLIVGIFAVLFGLVGAYAVRQHLQPPAEPVAAEEPEAPRPIAIPMAGTELDAGRPLKLSDIAIVRLRPEQFEQFNIPAAYMTNSQDIVGRILREPLKRGQTFAPEMFYPEGMGPSVAERLQPGFRALTIPIENAQSVAGLVVPGTVVDVLFRTNPDSLNRPPTTVTLLERVDVLALGQNQVPGARSTGSQNEGTVTLAVSPEQASILKVVEGRGDMSLAMRNPNDDTFVSQVTPQTLENLLGLAGSGSFTTEIYRGGQMERRTFERTPSAVIPGIQFPIRAPSQSIDTNATIPTSTDTEDAAAQNTPPTAPAPLDDQASLETPGGELSAAR